jgi:hypothetical protein
LSPFSRSTSCASADERVERFAIIKKMQMFAAHQISVCSALSHKTKRQSEHCFGSGKK